jgi:predicted secreted protein
MKNYFLYLVTLLLILSLIAGCSSVATVSVTKTITITTTNTIGLNNVDEIIQAELGKEFSISLKSNPSTGSIWIEEHSAKWLQFLGKTYTPDLPFTGPPIIVGGGGVDTFRFEPLEKGTDIIIMRYMRSWESSLSEQKVFLVVVT